MHTRWQYQNRSSRYSTDAIGAQWFADAAYNWENDLASGAARWEDFNGEAEGEFLEDAYAHGNLIGMPATGAGEFYKDDPIGSDVEFIYSPTPLPPPTPDYTTFASDSVAYVREAFAWRLSALI